MNLSKLFEMQKVLDERIVREKGLEGQDLLPNKILALQVELGELANEWRGFKHWSNNQKPNRKNDRWNYDVTPARIEEYDPLLEEYVDCLHFILSIGLEIGVDTNTTIFPSCRHDIVREFISLMRTTTDIDLDIRDESSTRFSQLRWKHLTSGFIGLGEMLGFTWEEVEAAYLAKNAVNHQRQSSGY